MTKITFHLPGQERVVAGEAGKTIMQVAVQAGIPGIVGECGGDMSCATCHVYCADQTGFKPASADEQDLLELVDDLRDSSRLSCQMKLTETIAEVSVEVPE
ncbi:2Fe-2S iron-sulfur cluster-binding protein [Nocardia sp. NPDC019395]|uniref:2Fe-2S iron-sulfur cluster-binding protein n=1 Tax=Nocardia sp. NPDC019395 TaxID=3154686 RepID=UPI0033E650A2